MTRPFKSELVLREQIAESTLKAYHVGFDQNRFRLIPLVEVIRKVIPEFALGYHMGTSTPNTEIVERLKEAASLVYTTDKYKRRGEFGELILHLLLRDFHNTVPLISKINFKDSHNSTIHGFDGVQVSIEGEHKKLWLGESKLYSDGLAGIKDLCKDLRNHIQNDYLRKEFSLISRKLPQSYPDVEHWRVLMDKHQTLDKIYSNIVLPMACTYSSRIFSTHTSETKQYLEAFENECRGLKCEFDKKTIKSSIEVILLLLPVPDKDELNRELDTRLKRMQQI
jgi:hypothetical protein